MDNQMNKMPFEFKKAFNIRANNIDICWILIKFCHITKWLLEWSNRFLTIHWVWWFYCKDSHPQHPSNLWERCMVMIRHHYSQFLILSRKLLGMKSIFIIITHLATLTQQWGCVINDLAHQFTAAQFLRLSFPSSFLLLFLL